MFTDTGTNPKPAAPGPQAAPGPKTENGKRVAARNATTHGLFARDVVLTHLGEDPTGYDALLQELTAQINPANLLEQQYVEKIAAASWRLRRLHRWQAQLFEDPDLTEDEALERLDRVLRHETALHRQIDTGVKMLGREVPHLFETRARKAALYERDLTERECAQDTELDYQVEQIARRKLRPRPLPDDFLPSRLDAAPPATENCQNEPTPSPPSPRRGEVARNEPEGVLSEGVLSEGVLSEGVLSEGVLSEGVLPEASPLTPPELGAGGPIRGGGLLWVGSDDRTRHWPSDPLPAGAVSA